MSIFRPHSGPAQFIFDALVKEQEHRKDRQSEEWIVAERNAVWSASRDYAQQHGLRVPTIDDVMAAENQAIGHCDYASTWAFEVVRRMKSPDCTTDRSWPLLAPPESDIAVGDLGGLHRLQKEAAVSPQRIYAPSDGRMGGRIPHRRMGQDSTSGGNGMTKHHSPRLAAVTVYQWRMNDHSHE